MISTGWILDVKPVETCVFNLAPLMAGRLIQSDRQQTQCYETYPFPYTLVLLGRGKCLVPQNYLVTGYADRPSITCHGTSTSPAEPLARTLRKLHFSKILYLIACLLINYVSVRLVGDDAFPKCIRALGHTKHRLYYSTLDAVAVG